MKIDKNILGATNTLNNNEAVLKLAQCNHLSKAMNILTQIAHNDDSLNSQIRIETVFSAFGYIDMGFSGMPEVKLPKHLSKSNVVEIAKANLLYIKSPVDFFKFYVGQNVQKALKWLWGYNTDPNNSNRIKNIKNIFKRLHIFDFGDSHSGGLSLDTWSKKFHCDTFLILTNGGVTNVIRDNANDGTGDTGAFVKSIAPTFRRISNNDIKRLIKLLDEAKK